MKASLSCLFCPSRTFAYSPMCSIFPIPPPSVSSNRRTAFSPTLNVFVSSRVLASLSFIIPPYPSSPPEIIANEDVPNDGGLLPPTLDPPLLILVKPSAFTTKPPFDMPKPPPPGAPMKQKPRTYLPLGSTVNPSDVGCNTFVTVIAGKSCAAASSRPPLPAPKVNLSHIL